MRPKVLAYFLPQFHSCEFNNQWWGEGFTEWSNVKAAKPLFQGHKQPIVPESGYFDLTEDGILSEQIKTANKHGIDGFVFYHYWYEGKSPLRKPLDILLEDKSIQLPFSLCWANHSWTRSWRNRQGSLDTLINQTYECDSEREAHFDFLAKAFLDERYIRIGDKPIFQIYVPEDIPDLKGFIDSLRQHFIVKFSTELHLIATVRANRTNFNYLEYFDSIVLAQPTVGLFSTEDIFASGQKPSKFYTKYLNMGLIRSLPYPVKKLLYKVQDRYFNKHQIFDFDDIWKKIIEQNRNAGSSKYVVHPCGFVGFDNTPRYGHRAKIVENFSPEKFQIYLASLAEIGKENNSELFFINAWNEWGEGMYLQEDNEYGDLKLKAVSSVFHEV